MPSKSLRLDAQRVGIAPKSLRGTASADAGGNRWYLSIAAHYTAVCDDRAPTMMFEMLCVMADGIASRR